MMLKKPKVTFGRNILAADIERTKASAQQHKEHVFGPALPTERQPVVTKPATSGIPAPSPGQTQGAGSTQVETEPPEYNERAPTPTYFATKDDIIDVYERHMRQEYHAGRVYPGMLISGPEDWRLCFELLCRQSWWRKQPIPFDCKVHLAKEAITRTKQDGYPLIPELWQAIAKGDAFAESLVAPKPREE